MKGHKWFAAIYDRMTASYERSFLGKVRGEICGGLTGKILEIGAGTGANFSHYRDGAEVVATEPDPFMLRRAEARLKDAHVQIDLKQAFAEDLPFDDASFDAVVSTLVMCSVPGPQKALAEIRRVLKPRRQVLLLQHIRYQNALGGLAQDLITPAWRWFGAGCHPNRDIGRLIRDAGFEIVESSLTKPTPPIPPMIFSRPHLRGVASAA